jgi:hypothetical protein
MLFRVAENINSVSITRQKRASARKNRLICDVGLNFTTWRRAGCVSLLTGSYDFRF